MKKSLLLLVSIFVLTACGKSNDIDNEDAPDNSAPTYPVEVEVVNGDFTYRLFTEKDVYDEYGETAIFAELTYTGEEDEIDIHHAASPFYFLLAEKTRDFNIGYPMNEPAITSTLKKDEPLREQYTFSGGYSDESDPEYVEFIQTIANKGFPKGNYMMTGFAQFYIINPSDKAKTEDFNMEGTIEFFVAASPNN